ncbi:MAG: hypothetical protein L3J04_06715 [Robiginitomaculum sp.]|nr:hypothetical protein [Robiginitomaculum sp.]
MNNVFFVRFAWSSAFIVPIFGVLASIESSNSFGQLVTLLDQKSLLVPLNATRLFLASIIFLLASAIFNGTKPVTQRYETFEQWWSSAEGGYFACSEGEKENTNSETNLQENGKMHYQELCRNEANNNKYFLYLCFGLISFSGYLLFRILLDRTTVLLSASNFWEIIF